MKRNLNHFFRKTIAFVFALFLCTTMLTVSAAYADSITTDAIYGICNQYGFKSGTYWTYDYNSVEKTQAALDAAATSNYKASTVPYGSKTYQSKHYSGSKTHYGEYVFKGGRQCYAFANFIGYQLTGSVPTNSWTKYNSVAQVEKAGGLKVGDVIRSSGHSAMVLKVSGTTIYTVECWGGSGSKNKISVGGYFNGDAKTLRDISRKYGFTAVYRYGGSSSDNQSTPSISASGEQYPSNGANLKEGSGFGLRGKYSTSAGKITKVSSSVTDSNGKTWFTYSAAPNSGKYDVYGTKGSNGETLNNTFVFNKLAKGSYTMTLTITAENAGKTASATVTRNFTVGSSASGSKTDFTIQKSFNGPDTIKKGKGFGLRGILSVSGGKITSVTATVIRSDGKTVLSYSATPNSTSFDVTKTKGTNGKSLNDTMVFNNLAKGNYTYSVTVKGVRDGVEGTYNYNKQFKVQ